MKTKGFWWLNHAEQHRSNGIYSFDNNGILLNAEGDFKEPVLNIPFNGCVKYIYGKLEDGKYCTLTKCSAISSRTMANGYDERTIKAECFLKGDHITNVEAYKSKSAKIVFNALRAWMQLNPFRSSETEDCIAAKYLYPKQNKLFAPSISAHFDFLYHYNGNHTIGKSITMECTPYIEITPDKPQTIDWYIKICNQTNQLLSLLSGFNYTCSSMFLENNSRLIHPIYQSHFIEIHSKEILNSSPLPTKDAGLIFINKHELEPQLATTIDTWFSLYEKFENVIDLFYSSIQSDINSKWTFLNLTFAAEKIHSILFEGKYIDNRAHRDFYNKLRPIVDTIDDKDFMNIFKMRIKHGNNYSLQDKILELFCCSGPITNHYVSDIQSFSEHVSKSRNSLAHGKTTATKSEDLPFDIITTNTALIVIIAYFLLKQLKPEDSFIDNKFLNTTIIPYI